MDWEALTDPQQYPGLVLLNPEILEGLIASRRQKLEEVYRANWSRLRSRFPRGDEIVRIYNFRLQGFVPDQIVDFARMVHGDQKHAYKLSAAYGFIHVDKISGNFSYFDAHQGNFDVLVDREGSRQPDDPPMMIFADSDLAKIEKRLRQFNVLQWGELHRPNSRLELFAVTNITFFVTRRLKLPLRGEFVGCGQDMPDHFKNRPGLKSTISKDNLCFFRCVARHLTGKKRVLKKIKELFRAYFAAKGGKGGWKRALKKFKGVRWTEFPLLKDVIQHRIEVYCMENHEDFTDWLCSRVHTVHSNERYEKKILFHVYETVNPDTGRVTQTHFSQITNMGKFSNAHLCPSCHKVWPDAGRLRRHVSVCKNLTKEKFPGGVYHPRPTVFQLLEAQDVSVIEALRYYEYFGVYDLEVCQPLINIQQEKTSYTREHQLLSISASSNIPGFNEFWKLDVDDAGGPKELVIQFMQHLYAMAKAAFRLLREAFRGVLDDLERKIGEEKQREQEQEQIEGVEEDDEVEQESCDLMELLEEDVEAWVVEEEEEEKEELEPEPEPGTEPENTIVRVVATSSEDEEQEKKKKKTYLEKLHKCLLSYLCQLHILGYNSGKYDLNVLKEYLIPLTYLQGKSDESELEAIQFMVKKGNIYMTIATEFLKFLDTINYLSPGYSYAKFLKGYLTEEQQAAVGGKGDFPYKAVTSPDWLNNTEFLAIEDFSSTLKGTTVSQEEYTELKTEVWQGKNMQTCLDLCHWYLEQDIMPFVVALQNMKDQYQSEKLDAFKDGISLPGLTLKYVFDGLRGDTFFSQPGSEKAYRLPRDNMVGGPSIIFHRYHQKGETYLRSGSVPVESVRGYDANALYLGCTGKEMPTGFATYWQLEEKPEGNAAAVLPLKYQVLRRGMDCRSRQALEWLEYEMFVQRQSNPEFTIQHQANSGTEKRLGKRGLPVDGWCDATHTAYQFHGDFTHGGPCESHQGKYADDKLHPFRRQGNQRMTYGDVRKETQANDAYLRQVTGGRLIVIWQSQWQQRKRNQPAIDPWLSNKNQFSVCSDAFAKIIRGRVDQEGTER